eukprot:2456148-Rhodomonas_salina.1
MTATTSQSVCSLWAIWTTPWFAQTTSSFGSRLTSTWTLIWPTAKLGACPCLDPPPCRASQASYAPTLASKSFPNLPDLLVALEGAKVLGLPVGSDHFCKEILVSKAATITAKLEPISHVDNGRHFAQLVRFCVKTQLWFTLSSALPTHTSLAASQLDAAATAAVGEYLMGQLSWEAESLPVHDDPMSHDCASLIMQLSLARGCWGLTLLEGFGAADPAFYAGYTEFLRWKQTSVPSLPLQSALNLSTAVEPTHREC